MSFEASFLVVGGVSPLVVVVGLLFSCGRMLFSNWEGGDSSMVVIRRGDFSSCDVQEATFFVAAEVSSSVVV